MKRYFLFVCFLLSGAGILRADDNRIDGQVFIATKGGENFKLALVSVSLYPAEQIAKTIADKEAAKASYGAKIDAMMRSTSTEYNSLEEKVKRAEDETYHRSAAAAYNPYPLEDAQKAASNAASEAGYWRSASNYLHSSIFYFADLPAPTKVVKTDADGKFSIAVPTEGSWVLAATASRNVGGDVEIYDWLVTIDVHGNTQVMLANDNAFGGDSSQCVVRDGVATNYSAIKGKDSIAEIRQEIEAVGAEEKHRIALQEEERQRKIFLMLPQLIKQSQARALAKHPDLGKATSPLNRKFVEEYQKLLSTKSDLLRQPDWPEKLADKCAEKP